MESSQKHVMVLGLLQVLAVVAGFCALAAVMKIHGYPEESFIRWRPLPRGLREHGQWLLLLPLAWTFLALLSNQQARGFPPESTAIVLGYALLILLVLLFLTAAANPFTRVMLWAPPATPSAG